MKNGRHNHNDSKRTTSGKFAKSTGSESSDTERSIAGIIETDPGTIEPIRIESSDANADDSNAIRDNKQFTLPNGFYFNTNGNVERIPDGHYIRDGRLRKRRGSRRSASDSADGNENRDRTETSETEKYLGEVPLRIESKTRRAAKKLNAEKAKLTMVAMIATGCSAIFTSVSLLTKHDHWQLAVEEAQHLSQALNDAIETLPAKYYAQITSIIEKWIPWINLSFVVGAIVIPRLEESAKRIEARNYQSSKGNNAGNAGTEASPVNGPASAFWNN
jgi:hypothetical protein